MITSEAIWKKDRTFPEENRGERENDNVSDFSFFFYSSKIK
jgi:hypothetical protein